MATPTPSPAMYTLDSPYECARWRPLVQWLLYLPHGLIVRALQAVNGIVFVVQWFVLLFTGRLDPGLHSFLTLHERYGARAGAFLVGHTEAYPPFDFTPGPADNGAHPPVELHLPELPTDVSRSALFNVVLAIPHYIVFAVYAVAAILVGVIGWFAVLFTARWPAPLRDWLVRLANYYYRVWAYVVMVEPSYPAFGTRRD